MNDHHLNVRVRYFTLYYIASTNAHLGSGESYVITTR